ncbi:MAG: hypothetical protein J7K88_04160 [Candidatus Fermentibacteraceae bacterium]|nr:hypothetical protein [Candidatus Fermentibacteraceae bacterium]
MRTFSVISAAVLFILSAACTTSEDNLTAPPLPTGMSSENGNASDAIQCQCNMVEITSSAYSFMGAHGYFPETLEELGIEGTICPSCGKEYMITATENSFRVDCPQPFFPNHGFVENGAPSWLNQQEQEKYACRANMRAITSGAVIFFAENERYPVNQEEMGLAWVVCPACSEQYEIIGGGYYFFVGCPMPAGVNHGNVDDGVPSWYWEPPDKWQWQCVCRDNMMNIASQAMIFFASNGRYPRNLEELGMTGTVCPACGEEYQFTGSETVFHVECPLPFTPNHGYIHDGSPSWQ